MRSETRKARGLLYDACKELDSGATNREERAFRLVREAAKLLKEAIELKG